jgi:hypothetical protein
MLLESGAETSVAFRRLRFRLGDFFVKMWLENAFLRLILPFAVSLKRFLAPLLVLIFGILLLSDSFFEQTPNL